MSATHSDMGPGLATLLSFVSVLAAAASGLLAYDYAVEHAADEAAQNAGAASGLVLDSQVLSGLSFGVAVAVAGLAVAAVHVYDG